MIIYNYDAVRCVLKSSDTVLVVADVCDTGDTLDCLINEFKKTKSSLDIKSAVLFYKPGKSTTGFVPDFYCWKTNNWVVFPHDNFNKKGF